MARKRAVFLDRDGVINEEVDHLNKIEDLKILPGVVEAIAALNQAGFLAVVISNQAAIAKGMLSPEGLEEINAELARQLEEGGASIDAFYSCFHHPEASVKKYKAECNCRKPSPGMLLRAAEDLNIDMSKSFMIGDTTSDILAGKRAKVKTVLVGTGYGGRDGKHAVEPDIAVKGLPEAVAFIMRKN